MRKEKTFIGTIVTVIAVVLLQTGCASSAVSRTDLYKSYFDKPVSASGKPLRYEKVGETDVFHLAGDEYTMGFQYGKKAAELGVAETYDEIFRNATAMWKDDAPRDYRNLITVSMVKHLLVDAWNLMAPFVPEYMMRMLSGFAEGSGLSLEDVHAMHAIPDFTETSCSGLWATGSATAGGASVQIRVLDYIMGLGIQKFPAVVFMDFEPGFQVANVGWLGLLGVISGMNETGLAVSEMGYGNPDGENLHGTPMPFLLLDVLRWAETPEEASGIVRSHARTNSYVYVIGSDSHGGLIFDTNAYSVESYAPGDTEAPIKLLPDMVHAGHYQERMDALVAEQHGSISVEWLKNTFIPEIAMNSNLQSVVYDLTNREFFVANAPNDHERAADQPYTLFGFKQ